MKEPMAPWPPNPRGSCRPYDWHLVACHLRVAAPGAPIEHVILVASAALDIEPHILAEFYGAVDLGVLPHLAEFQSHSHRMNQFVPSK